MHATKIFYAGSSQAIQIPAELAYENADIELEIERIGDEIRVRPVRRHLTEILQKFAAFDSEFPVEDRLGQEQAKRSDF
jgi:antitoxin VapB